MFKDFGTPKIINFPFGTNGKFIISRCPNTETLYSNLNFLIFFSSLFSNIFSFHFINQLSDTYPNYSVSYIIIVHIAYI